MGRDFGQQGYWAPGRDLVLIIQGPGPLKVM